MASIIKVKLPNGEAATIPAFRGPPGENKIDSETKTSFNGLLKGTGSGVAVAERDVDYSSPEGVAQQIKTLLNRQTAVHEADTSYSTFMARGIALVSEDAAESISVPNGAVVLVYTR